MKCWWKREQEDTGPNFSCTHAHLQSNNSNESPSGGASSPNNTLALNFMA